MKITHYLFNFCLTTLNGSEQIYIKKLSFKPRGGFDETQIISSNCFIALFNISL